MKKIILQISLLTRFKLSGSVAFSTWVAYILASDTIPLNALWVSFGVFLLSSGASALNQIQERNFDARMQRTHLRPIPNGTLSLSSAYIIAAIFLISGLSTLLFAASYISMLLGLFSLLWYNLLYTKLKRITAFAMLPGTLTGVIPIIIGWQAASGNLQNQSFLFICLFMMVWQLPHFILLMLRFRDDYQKAGFPALTDRYSIRSVKDTITSGIIALLTVTGGMVYYDIFQLLTIKILSIILSLAFLFIFLTNLYKKQSTLKTAFISINIFMLMIMILLLVDKLLL